MPLILITGRLRIAVKPGIKELFLGLCINIKEEYNFPCELLSSDAAGSSVHSVFLVSCALRPTATTLGSLTSLTSLSLWAVHINDQELGCLFSNSFALESLEIGWCNELICLKLPSSLRQFNFLKVSGCKMLQRIEINAPRLANFQYGGAPIQISLGDLLQVKHIDLHGVIHSGMVYYARAKLPYIAPSVQSLTLSSYKESILQRYLASFSISRTWISCSPEIHRYFALTKISFLWSLILTLLLLWNHLPFLTRSCLRHDSILDDPTGDHTQLRQKPGCRHDCLKKMVCLTLDTAYDPEIHELPNMETCWPMSRESVEEAHKSLEAITRYTEGKVPSNVNLEVLRPCNRCHVYMLQCIARYLLVVAKSKKFPFVSEKKREHVYFSTASWATSHHSNGCEP
uniref:At1g61320/AtMIF1 LRR domain-containing protein n=1 Tax=Leersia perrieri TaxID=77586 RepID=A0A0D9VF26_9ORYZ